MLTLRENHAQEVNGAQRGTVESPAKRRTWRQWGWVIHICMYIYIHIHAYTSIFICHTVGIKKNQPQRAVLVVWAQHKVKSVVREPARAAGMRPYGAWYCASIFPRTNECKLARNKHTPGIKRGLWSLEEWGYEIAWNGFRNCSGLDLTTRELLMAPRCCTLYPRPEKSANISVSPTVPAEKTC